MKLHITNIFREQKVSKAGKPFQSVRIQTTEYPGKYISGFGNKANESWSIGSEVDVEVVQKGEYLNFEMPKATPSGNSIDSMAINTKLSQIQAQLASIIGHLSGKNRLDTTSAGTKVPDFNEVDANDINVDEIPFN